MTTPFHTREAWGARSPKTVSRNLAPRHVTAHWGGPSPWGNGPKDHNRCASIVRAWQSYHMDGHGWSDIAYTSCVCPHGHRYEGRGPGVRTAANGTNAGNNASYAVVYIGGEGDSLTSEAKLAYLDEADRLQLPLDKAHSDWKSTSCPGNELRDWIHSGHPDPGGHGPAPIDPPILPPTNIDWAAVRRICAAQLADSLSTQSTITRSSHPFAIALVQSCVNMISPERNLKVDGSWGPATESAVRAFQGFFGLTVDSIFGDASRWFMILLLRKIQAGG